MYSENSWNTEKSAELDNKIEFWKLHWLHEWWFQCPKSSRDKSKKMKILVKKALINATLRIWFYVWKKPILLRIKTLHYVYRWLDDVASVLPTI